MKLESIVEYLNGYLAVTGHPDYPGALNGLQVEGAREVTHVVAAVDASVASVEAAVAAGGDLMLVHHGLFWGGTQPLTGPLFRRVATLVRNEVGLYSCHLPLDAHPEVGNCTLLARALGLRLEERFGAYEGAPIGWRGVLDEPVGLSSFEDRLSRAVGGKVHVVPGGPKEVRTVGVVTGGAGSFTREAAAAGLDAFVTGEGAHHNHFDAMELGVHLLLGGHYATETFGVRALAQHLAKRFDLAWTFIDQPTGL